MRTRAEILDGGLRANEKPTTEARTAYQIDLLTLEVLVDIRDALITDCKDAMNALIEIRKLS